VRNLTRSGDQAHLVLDGQIYTLRITRAGKLILTK
jgi:hemin uptake protein HemP